MHPWRHGAVHDKEKNMSENTLISADLRDRVGKGSARAARRAGKIPAVIYGNKKEPIAIEIEARLMRKIIHEPGIFSRLLDINVDNGKHTVLMRDIHFHPVTDCILISSGLVKQALYLLRLVLNLLMRIFALH
jgi:ribosomal protein L25 (general stress protein Ctc)